MLPDPPPAPFSEHPLRPSSERSSHGLGVAAGRHEAIRHVHRGRPRDPRRALGDFLALLGPSGCGKTTLLRMIAGFEQPTEGEVRISGQVVNGVPPHQRDVNTMFQQYALFPHMTVRDNVAFGLRAKKVPSAEITKRVADMLEIVHLTEFAHASPRSCRAASSSAARSPGPSSTADGAPARRAPRRPRPQASPHHAERAQADPPRDRHDLHLRHPRPGGGAHHEPPHRGHEPRPHRAAR